MKGQQDLEYVNLVLPLVVYVNALSRKYLYNGGHVLSIIAYVQVTHDSGELPVFMHIAVDTHSF